MANKKKTVKPLCVRVRGPARAAYERNGAGFHGPKGKGGAKKERDRTLCRKKVSGDE